MNIGSMLHVVVEHLKNGVDRITLAEQLERSDEPDICTKKDMEEPRTRDLIEAGLERLGLTPAVDALIEGSSCKVDNQTHLYAWWHAPTLEGVAA